MARPSTYADKDYETLAEQYLETCGRDQTKLPKISEFCRVYIGSTDETVKKWCDEDKTRVSLIASIKRIKDAQKEQLMDDGLYGGREVNNAMAIFLLKANHGMIETDRHEFAGDTPIFSLNLNEIRSNNTSSKVSAETD